MQKHSKIHVLIGKLPVILAAVLLVASSLPTTKAQTDCRYSLRGCGLTVSGRIMDGCGNALPGVTVGIKSLDGAFMQSTTTDAQGDYRLENIPEGDDYVVMPKASGMPSGGFVTPDSTFIDMSANQTAIFYYRRMTMFDICQTPIVYASDLRFSETYNQFTQAHRDESAVGTILQLNGVVYHKGLGVHSNSEITFRVDGQYSSFVSDIGVNDTTGMAGLVAFSVVADDLEIYNSGQMAGGTPTKTVNVNVAGAKVVKLVVNYEGDFDSDHADWANARFVR